MAMNKALKQVCKYFQVCRRPDLFAPLCIDRDPCFLGGAFKTPLYGLNKHK